MKTNKTNTLKNSSGGGVLKGYYFSIFIVVLLTTTFLALNFIPLLTKYGDSNAETADVSVEIGPVLSLTLTEEEITLNPTPTPEGTFIHDTLSAIVDTNNKTGYTLTMNTEEEETALSQEDGVTKIDSLANEVTVTNTNQNNFTMNHWGYALAETVAESDTTFNKIPALSTPATIKTSDAPVSDDTTPVTLATRVDTSLPSGTYKNTLVFSATANFTPAVIPPENTSSLTQALKDADTEFQEAADGKNYYAMQSMTSSICNAVPTPSRDETTVPEATLIDIRDQELYTVRKLADGNCWMTQNLRLKLSTSKSLTPADSNVSTNWTPTHNSQISGDNWHDSTPPLTLWDEPIGEAKSHVIISNKEKGGYYTWYAATAGQGTYSMSTKGQEVASSICPKSWRLPSGKTDSKSFANLIKTYYPDYTFGDSNRINNDGTIYGQPLSISAPNFYNGHNGSIDDNVGYLWTSTVYNEQNAYSVEYSDHEIVPQYIYQRKHYGPFVRCVVQ